MKKTDVTIKDLYDVVIIGGGPAGLTAALYLARARYRVIVVEKEHFGGQITITSEIVNFPGVEHASGESLTKAMQKQAQNFGAEFLSAEAIDLQMEHDIKIVKTNRRELHCFGVLLATGAHPRKVGFSGEEDFKGRGVAYCATCDGEFFTDKEVFVIGGGFAAAEESVFLSKYARHVTVLIRGDGFTCAPSVAMPALNHEKITVIPHVQVEEVSGGDKLTLLRYRNTQTGEMTQYQAPDGESFGIFIFAGYEPATGIIRNLAECNEQGYIITDRNQKTSCEGLYAAGDVCIKPLRQVVTAVGDGALAATALERYVTVLQKKTGLRPSPPSINFKETSSVSDKNPISGNLFTPDMLSQLENVFQHMASSLVLKLTLDNTPISDELKRYVEELGSLTDKLSIEMTKGKRKDLPCVEICRKNGEWTGLSFHGVPGGHEFTSFILGLYNAAGPGQSLDKDILHEIQKLNPVDMKILVSLSCTMCPELVTSAQRIAAENPGITAEVYDLNHFPELREQYRIMSVPCLIINNGEKISFGKKNLLQLLDLLNEKFNSY